jgi:hypothetical protein
MAVINPITLEEPRTPSVIFAHLCEHPGCRQWGGWGFTRGKATVWFSSEHRAEGERHPGLGAISQGSE